MRKGNSLKKACLYAACTTVLAVTGTQTLAAVFPEVEPNDNKAAANPVVLTAAGDSIVGNSTGSSTITPGPASADYYLVTTPNMALGIYRNRLQVTSNTLGQASTIRGLGQVATGPSGIGPGLPSPTALDNTVQTASTVSTPPRFVQWYTFGAPAQMYYRVTGVSTTTADYTSTYSVDPVAVTPLGSFVPGSITLTNTGLNSTVDSEVIVYDSNFQQIAGYLNDDFLDGTVVPPGGSTLNSILTRNYGVGTYYVAISNFNTADSQLSPADEGTATGNVMDFPGVMANSSTSLFAAGFPFQISDANGPVNFTVFKPGPFDIAFFSFDVVPEPGSLGLLAVAVPMMLRRRKA